MTPEDVRLVQTSFAQVFPHKARLTQRFYAHLFRIAPEMRPLFRNDPALQREKHASALGAIVRSLQDLGTALPTAAALAQRDVG
ncbi:Globin [Tranquillimonas rosea]|uniref:Globin n=1 Tax=Tranquillimonas rosea TaxID=641238 RepID=A0A1H9UAH4_9RHOB|nr:globin domain-containing protein [Tranquillimonas rosea]SES06550.1 Globin [Tranquillimonas rosea]